VCEQYVDVPLGLKIRNEVMALGEKDPEARLPVFLKGLHIYYAMSPK
jgi:hypothetical protein